MPAPQTLKQARREVAQTLRQTAARAGKRLDLSRKLFAQGRTFALRVRVLLNQVNHLLL
jgi:BMFP domain-containing protein YqiC